MAFSYAGKRLGLEDARGTLFYHYATFLQKLQPKMLTELPNRPQTYPNTRTPKRNACGRKKPHPPLQTAPCSAWLTGKCRAYEEKTRPYYAIEGKTAHFIRRPVFSFCYSFSELCHSFKTASTCAISCFLFGI